jgi:hypothetical protein
MLPQTVFVVLGVSRDDVARMGMSGCSLQLNDSGEISWVDTAILLDGSRREVKTFLRVQGKDFVHAAQGNHIRISVPDAREYFMKYPTIELYLDSYDRNRFIRLGSRCYLEPWNLNSEDSFILRMSDEEFNLHYISDPRCRVTTAEILRRIHLHKPVLIAGKPRGLPDPDGRGWI